MKKVLSKGYEGRDAQELDAYRVSEAARRAQCSPGKIFLEIKEGRLRARKIGNRTVILREDFLAWLRGLPVKAGPSQRHSAIALARWSNRRTAEEARA